MKTSVHESTDRAARLLDRAADAARDGSSQLREHALAVSDRTVGYVRDEPVKAMLIALAVGAGIAALFRVSIGRRG